MTLQEIIARNDLSTNGRHHNGTLYGEPSTCVRDTPPAKRFINYRIVSVSLSATSVRSSNVISGNIYDLESTWGMVLLVV